MVVVGGFAFASSATASTFIFDLNLPDGSLFTQLWEGPNPYSLTYTGSQATASKGVTATNLTYLPELEDTAPGLQTLSSSGQLDLNVGTAPGGMFAVEGVKFTSKTDESSFNPGTRLLHLFFISYTINAFYSETGDRSDFLYNNSPLPTVPAAAPYSQESADYRVRNFPILYTYEISTENSLFRVLDGDDAMEVISRSNSTITGRATLRAVPEPATWAMMICGFGLAGAALRRRKPVQT